MTGPVEWLLRRITRRPKCVPDPHRIKLLELVNEAEFHAERIRVCRDLVNGTLPALAAASSADARQQIDAYAHLRLRGLL